jgi:hypothetical protein
MSRPIFEEPPDDMPNRAGALIINWAGEAGMSAPEVRDAFQTAAERLLDAAIGRREHWEALYPILFCYRHALEIALKAALPAAAHDHRLPNLWNNLQPRLVGRMPPDQITWLGERIAEFIHVDPRSTAFRYHDAVPSDRDTELWVDFHHLKATMARLLSMLTLIEGRNR